MKDVDDWAYAYILRFGEAQFQKWPYMSGEQRFVEEMERELGPKGFSKLCRGFFSGKYRNGLIRFEDNYHGN